MSSKAHYRLPATVCVCAFKGRVICFHELLIGDSELHVSFFAGYRNTFEKKKKGSCVEKMWKVVANHS